jgi:PhnB protein
MTVKPGSVLPYICVQDASEAIDFYVAAFGARELFRLVDPSDGRIGHAEIQIGEAVIMLSDEYPDFGAVSPPRLGGSPVKFQVYVEDVDAAFARALAAGAVESRPVADEFFGDRLGSVVDPFGHTWTLAMQVEEISPGEMQRRWNESGH